MYTHIYIEQPKILIYINPCSLDIRVYPSLPTKKYESFVFFFSPCVMRVIPSFLSLNWFDPNRGIIVFRKPICWIKEMWEKKKKERGEKKHFGGRVERLPRGDPTSCICIPNTRVNKIRLFFAPVDILMERSLSMEGMRVWLINTSIFTHNFSFFTSISVH